MHYIPSWLPDEIIFSLASRYHFYTLGRSSLNTSLNLFGVGTSGTHHDFPAGIDYFAEICEGKLGAAEDIICERSVLPYITRFQDDAVRKLAIASMRGSAIGSLKATLGLLNSWFRTNLPLKACPSCIVSDIDTIGEPYWHRTHQVPGIWLCPDHRVPLRQASVKTNHIGKYRWFLPEEEMLQASMLEERWMLTKEAERVLYGIAEVALRLLSLPCDYFFDLEQLSEFYRQRLKVMGWVSTHGKNRLEYSAKRFCERYVDLRFIPEFSLMPSSVGEAESFLKRSLRLSQIGRNPLRHVFMIHFLYGDWDEFMKVINLECTREAPQSVLPKRSDADRADLATPEQQRFIKLVLEEGLSIRVAARICGVSVGTGIMWAAKFQLPVKIRPKFIDAAKKTSIEQVLKEGGTLGEVAQSENVCVATVQKILSGSESLRKEWQEAKFRRVRDRWRACISSFLQRNPSAGREKIKKSCRAAFAWLSRHDREWLCENLPPPIKLHKSTEPKVDWKQRDREYRAEVGSKAEKIQANYSPCKIPLSHLLGDLPEIRGKLTLMNLMPLTQELIQQLTGKLKACPRN